MRLRQQIGDKQLLPGKCQDPFDNEVYILGQILSWFKGQLISKELFGILKFFQKPNERIRFQQGEKTEFVCSFLEESLA